jgi:hypothetical protein
VSTAAIVGKSAEDGRYEEQTSAAALLLLRFAILGRQGGNEGRDEGREGGSRSQIQAV